MLHRFLIALALCGTVSAKERPNIVVVLCDDLGYGDIGCYGNEVVKTPHLDSFARESLKLNHCYAAAPNCSPARAGLMTGRTPFRVGIFNWIPMLSPMHVKEGEITVATLLRDAGYDTCHVGKWHLNGRFNLDGQPQPGDHGFNHWFSTQNNALPNHRNPNNFVRNGETVGPLEGYAAPLVVDEAIDWLQTRRDREKPFFLFVCFHEPHEPIATDSRYEENYRDYAKGNRSFMAHHGNITQMDEAFGRLMKEFDTGGLRDSTFVFFTSDNGPAITGRHPHGSTGGLREKKGHLYEGGIRVPGLIRWPGRTTEGSESDIPVSGVDLLPTLCELMGAEIPQDRAIDGASFLPALQGKPLKREKPLYWHFYRASSQAQVVMRDGPWKITASLDAPDPARGADLTKEEMTVLKTADLRGFELYQLDKDPSESRNLAEENPEKLAELRKKLTALFEEVREDAPIWPEWKWPRYESQRIEWPEYRGERLQRE